jgi:hypothetical protein
MITSDYDEFMMDNHFSSFQQPPKKAVLCQYVLLRFLVAQTRDVQRDSLTRWANGMVYGCGWTQLSLMYDSVQMTSWVEGVFLEYLSNFSSTL